MKNTIKYLQGSENSNTLGTILGIQRGKNSKIITNPMAILLYLDQRTGRIERYLVNSPDKQPIEILLDIEKYYITNEEQTFKNLNYGKLDSTFFNGFLLELFRDYLHTFNSYKICDMYYIRNYTLPLYNHRVDGSVGVGSGTRIPNTIPLTGTKPFYAKRFIELNDNKPLVLNIPQYLYSQANKPALESYWDIKLNTYAIDSKSPQILHELKMTFNTKKILNLDNLNDQVIKFNKRTQDKLNKLEANSST